MRSDLLGRAWNTVAAKVLRTCADNAPHLANLDCHERRVFQMSNTHGDIHAFLDHVYHAIHEQHFHVDVLIAPDEFAHNRRNIAPAE